MGCFKRRKVLSSPRSTYLPNIFARRDPHAAARSARLRAAKSVGRTRKQRSAVAGSNSNCSTRPHAGQHRHTRMRPLKPLQRCNTALGPPPVTHPQMPGAFNLEPSIVVPGFPDMSDRHIPPLVAQKIFLDALYTERQQLLRAADERAAEVDAADEAECARMLERDSRKARAARRRRRAREAEAARRKAEDEEYARLLEVDRRRAQEAHRRAVGRERREEERRRAERREREHRKRERERRDRERSSAAERVKVGLAQRIRQYEAAWSELRRNDETVAPRFAFCNVPWPVFEDVRRIEDITRERVLAFVCHPLQERVLAEGRVKAIRAEIFRWHPDKFNGRVLKNVIEEDREAVRDTAGHVASILTTFGTENR